MGRVDQFNVRCERLGLAVAYHALDRPGHDVPPRRELSFGQKVRRSERCRHRLNSASRHESQCARCAVVEQPPADTAVPQLPAGGAAIVAVAAPRCTRARGTGGCRGDCGACAQSGDRHPTRCRPGGSRWRPPARPPAAASPGPYGASRRGGRCHRSSRRSAEHGSTAGPGRSGNSPGAGRRRWGLPARWRGGNVLMPRGRARQASTRRVTGARIQMACWPRRTCRPRRRHVRKPATREAAGHW